MEYNFGGSLKQKMYGDLTGNYYSTNHFVERNNLEHIAEELFGENWEAEDDVEQIKQIIDFIGHNKLYVVVVPSDRSEWHNLMSTYGDSLSKWEGDSNYDIFVIDSSEYKGEYEFGGKIKYTNKFKSVGTIGSDEFYIRNFGKVSTEYFDDIELLVVAKIQDLNEYISQEEIKKLGGEFQLDITLIPTEKHLSLDIVAEARENTGLINDIISVENYMGGLNYSPEDKSIFKTFDEAEEYLMSKEFNDKISADSVLSGYILDNKYNRAGQSNWDFLAYMMGEKESFWGNGGQITESDFNTNKELRIGNVKLILRKLQNPTYYRVEEYLLEGDTWEKYGSFGSRNWNDVVNEINFISENKGYEGQYEKGGGIRNTEKYYVWSDALEKYVTIQGKQNLDKLYEELSKIQITSFPKKVTYDRIKEKQIFLKYEANKMETGGGVGDFSEYSNDALTEAIINLSRYENNEELIQILKEELERRKKINNQYQSSFEKGGFTSEELWDDNLTPQEELDEIVQNLDEDEYESLCYEYNIDVEDANEMATFIYQLNDRDAIDLINRYKKENGGSIESEISKEQLENMIGRKLNGWNDDKVEHKGVLYQKCFLKPNYKKC